MKKAIYLITLVAFFFCIAGSCSKKDPAQPALPIADFTIKSDANGKVIFTNTSKNAIKFLWDFGNNITSSARDTTIQYIKNTTYRVSLIVSSSDGKSDTKEIDVVVSNIEIPEAGFTFKNDTHGKVVFTNTSKSASKFFWNFGNNLTSTAIDTTIQYIKNTTYKVSLTISSQDGKSDRKEMDVVVSNVEIPTRMSFEGTLGTKKISLIDGVENIRFRSYYADCCANYITELYEGNYRLIQFYISQSENGGNSSKTYQDIVKNIFVRGYNKSGTITPVWSGIGMYIDYAIDADRSSPFEDKKIEVIEVLKEENKVCICDTESFWIKYKVEIKNLKGILTIRYENPCCLK